MSTRLEDHLECEQIIKQVAATVAKRIFVQAVLGPVAIWPEPLFQAALSEFSDALDDGTLDERDQTIARQFYERCLVDEIGELALALSDTGGSA